MTQDLQHPDITHAMQTGYDRATWRDMQDAQRKTDAKEIVRDWYGDIVDLENDHYVVIPTGYRVLHRNLQRYLEERRGFEFNYFI